MHFITDNFIERTTVFPELIDTIGEAFVENNISVPPRHHHHFGDENGDSASTMLLMPAWSPNRDSGIKMLNIYPNNSTKNLPTVQGLFILINSKTGETKAILDAKNLTNKRTAATSALASKYLSRKDSNSLLMVGTGALSIHLILAHCSIRPIKEVFIWGRNYDKAKLIANKINTHSFTIRAIESIEDVQQKVDIISCATAATTPLIHGNNLIPGQHIDLVGSYRPDMRESDDETMKRATIFLDTMSDGMKDNGDILFPLESGAINKQDIKGDLFSLCSNAISARNANEEITLFKSVGYALEDLVAAEYYYKKWLHEKNI